jgi:hypothetical protein
MARQEVKQIALSQCAREKKIALRNIIIAIPATILLSLLWIYAPPSLILYNQQAIAGVESHDFSGLLQMRNPGRTTIVIDLPVEETFRRLPTRKEYPHGLRYTPTKHTVCNIVSKTKVYLTIIPRHSSE